LDAMQQQIEETRAAAQREQEAAEAQARQIIEEAQERADNLVSEARATAERIRTDSERELAAATQRRDSINQQLTNVRQMLATLTGSATGFAVDPLPGIDDPEGAPAADAPATDEPEGVGDAEPTDPVEAAE